MENSNIRIELSALQYLVAAMIETHPDKLKLLALYDSRTTQALNEGLFGNITDAAIDAFRAERSRWTNVLIEAIGREQSAKRTPPPQ